MKNIIKELANEAGVSIDGMGFGEGDIEGFAKLIIKECSQKCVYETDRQEILAHFGVE